MLRCLIKNEVNPAWTVYLYQNIGGTNFTASCMLGSGTRALGTLIYLTWINLDLSRHFHWSQFCRPKYGWWGILTYNLRFKCWSQILGFSKSKVISCLTGLFHYFMFLHDSFQSHFKEEELSSRVEAFLLLVAIRNNDNNHEKKNLLLLKLLHKLKQCISTEQLKWIDATLNSHTIIHLLSSQLPRATVSEICIISCITITPLNMRLASYFVPGRHFFEHEHTSTRM